MDRRLLRYYNRELQHLRGMAGEFAEEFPKIAGRLSLSEIECVDPYVERLLEGFAFLASRVHLKLDAEFPRFTQAVLETVYPHYLAPTPSMALVQFRPDLTEGSLAEGFAIPRQTSLRSILGKGEQTACEYRTAHEVTLWPVRVAEAQYYTRGLDALDIGDVGGASAGIHLRIESTAGLSFSDLSLDSLTFYLRGTGDIPMRICEQVFAQCASVVVRPAKRPVSWEEALPASRALRRVGYNEDEALLPCDARSFQGYRLLQEYFAFPQRFMFFELRGLSPAVRRWEGTELEIIILLRQADFELENNVNASSFELFCSPAVNLSPKRADRIHLSDRFSEFHVVPDRTRPIDFEVYRVLNVTGHGVRSSQEQNFLPFYSASDFEPDGGGSGAYFTVNRVPRTASSRERRYGRRSRYAGSEVYVSLVDAKAAPYRSSLRQLSVDTLCTNRDLPMQMPVGRGATDFTMETSAPVEAIKCVGGPTAPKASYAEGESAWRMISHLSLNYLSLTNADEQEGAVALRDLLKLYGDSGNPETRKEIEGVKSVKQRSIVRRVATSGPIAFARGLEITVTFDDAAFEGTGVFLLGAVLDQFFAKYVSINSFTETVIRTTERGEVMRWPARLGQRHIL